jgi:hypothetical protein
LAGWSSPQGGRSDTIWIAHGPRTADTPLTSSPHSRTEAIHLIKPILEEAIRSKRRVLLSFDFAYGYPVDFAPALQVVEGKRKRKNVSAAIDQAERYSSSIGTSTDFTFAGGPWGKHKVPFVFAANGRSYLKQIETESGIWFRDTRRSANHRRALVNWPTPEGLLSSAIVSGC